MNTKEKISTNEKLYANILNSLPLAISRFTPKNLSMTFLNNYMCKFLGIKKTKKALAELKR